MGQSRADRGLFPFAVVARMLAEEILGHIDPYLYPRVYALGVPTSDSSSRAVVAGPPDILQSIGAPESVPSLAEGAALDYLGDLCGRLERWGDGEGNRSFSSPPVRLPDGLTTRFVLQVRRPAFEAHYALACSDHGGFYVAPSLISAAIFEYMRWCTEELGKPTVGFSSTFMGVGGRTLLRDAGASLAMSVAALATGFDVDHIGGWHGLYDSCCAISSLPYEGLETRATIYIARPSHPSLRYKLRFATPAQLADHRASRKLLEIARSADALVSDGTSVYGVAAREREPVWSREDFFEVVFSGRLIWELRHGPHVLMQVVNGIPRLDWLTADERHFRADFARLFGDEGDVDAIWYLVTEARAQKRGAIVVVSPEAETEARRLSSQCMQVVPTRLSPELVHAATSIDGAVIVSPDGTCHAIGAILDGVATGEGDPARGARFNGANTYVQGRPGAMAVVVSEDGTSDTIPASPRPVPRSVIDAAVRVLGDVEGQAEPDEGRFYRALNVLDKHRRYLDAETCATINELKTKIEERLDHVRVVYGKFVPQPDADDSFFLDE